MNKAELNNTAELPEVEQPDVAKLHQIAMHLESKVPSLPTSPGLYNGKGGAILYFYMYALWVNDDAKYINLCEQLLHSAIQDMYKSNASNALYYSEISELGTLISYLQQEEFLDASFNDILITIDDRAGYGARLLCDQNNFDRFTGYLTIGQYFLLRYNASVTAREGLHLIIDTLLQSGIAYEGGGKYWESKLFNDDRIYLGWSHGSASVILFMADVLSKNIHYRPNAIKICLAAACRYIIDQKVDRTDSIFPDIIGEEKSNSPLNLCYGDLGIGYALLKAGEVLNDLSLISAGKTALLHSANRRFLETCNVHDASIIYGASGNMIFFKSLFNKYPNEAYEQAADYWYSVVQQKTQHPTKPAGYASYYNQSNPYVNETLFEGVPGLGLALIAYQSESADLVKLIGY